MSQDRWQKPYAGQTFFLRQKGADNIALPKALPNPENSRRYVQPSIHRHAQTDADGKFEFEWIGDRGFSQTASASITVE